MNISKRCLQIVYFSEIHEIRPKISLDLSRPPRPAEFVLFIPYWSDLLGPCKCGESSRDDKQGRWRPSDACDQSAAPRTHSALSTRIVPENKLSHSALRPSLAEGVFLSFTESNDIAFVYSAMILSQRSTSAASYQERMKDS